VASYLLGKRIWFPIGLGGRTEPSPHMVYCLSIDMIGSTQAGLAMTTASLDQFNRSLVKQITPHLEKLSLDDVLMKFTGDGWLLMISEVRNVPALCCLAIIMATRFQSEMSQMTRISEDKIPPLRLAICAGRDIGVQLPDGRKDWVGDSARRATRASECCRPNEILIDETVRSVIMRDFAVLAADVEQQPGDQPPRRREENFPLFALSDIKSEVSADSKSPECFVYTLTATGRTEEAATIVEQVEQRLEKEASKPGIAEKDRQGILQRWNRLMASIPGYSSAVDALKKIRSTGLGPNVETYNALMAQAPNYEAAKAWVETMRAGGVSPGLDTYNTLIRLAPDYATAKGWVEAMRAGGLSPDVAAYNTLFGKNLAEQSAEEILKWYSDQPEHPEEPIETAIAAFGELGRADQAFRLALDYPHLETARKLMRDHRNEAIRYFRSIAEGDPQHPNADFALGVAFLEMAQKKKAQKHLKKALELAATEPRKTAIGEWLRQAE